MTITATEFKNNISKYLEMSKTENIYITKNGMIISKLTNPYKAKSDKIKSIFGIVLNNVSFEETMEDSYSKI